MSLQLPTPPSLSSKNREHKYDDDLSSSFEPRKNVEFAETLLQLQTPPPTTSKTKEQTLTPPSTSSKNKENEVPDESFTHSEAKKAVEFAQHDQLHPIHSTSPLRPRTIPASRHVSRPIKSILKPFGPQAPMAENGKETTPEPENPLDHPEFIQSPMTVILASLGADSSLNLRDIIEAWTALFNRLRPRFPVDERPEPIPALQPIVDHVPEFLTALTRDLSRALHNPVAKSDSILPLSNSVPSDPSVDSSPPPKKGGYTEYEVTYARDLFLLSQAALRCLSLVFWVPQIYSLFSDESLHALLSTLLSLPLFPGTLPTPTPRKTYTLAMWVLHTQRLPPHILAFEAEGIVKSINIAVEGGFGREGKRGAGCEGLSAIQTLCTIYAPVFTSHLASLVPAVMTHLSTPPSESNAAASPLRTKAAQALSYLALCLPHMPLTPAVDVTIPSLSPPYASAPYTITLLSALVTLAGPTVFTTPPLLHIVLSNMKLGMQAKKAFVKLGARAIWCLLIRAWVLSDQENAEVIQKAGKIIRQAKGDTEERKVAETGLLQRPVGVSLVAAFMSRRERHDDVATALRMVREMIRAEIPEGFPILLQLLSSPADSATFKFDPSKLIPSSILRGRLISNVPNVNGNLKDMFDDECVKVEDIRPLEKDEGSPFWELLCECWETGIRKGGAGEDPLEIIYTLWSRLLCFLPNPEESPSPLPQILYSFLTLRPKAWTHPTVFDEHVEDAQAFALSFVRELLVRVPEAFRSASLWEEIVEALLATDEWDLWNEGTRSRWIRLMADVVYFCETPVEVLGRMEEGVRMDVWAAVATKMIDDEDKDYDKTMAMLGSQLCDTKMEDGEWDVWTRLALRLGDNLDESLQSLFEGVCSEVTMQALCLLFSAVTSPAILPSNLLSLASRELLATQPSTPSSLAAISLIAAVINYVRTQVDATALLQVLKLVEDGVIVWIRDEAEKLTPDVYNTYPIVLYSTFLSRLSELPIASLPPLPTLAPFLSSAFVHIPPPALGPIAFKEFWRRTYKDVDPQGDIGPLKECLRSFVVYDGWEFTGGWIEETQTQSAEHFEEAPAEKVEEGVVVADSQSPIKESYDPDLSKYRELNHALLSGTTPAYQDTSDDDDDVGNQAFIASSSRPITQREVSSPNANVLGLEYVSTQEDDAVSAGPSRVEELPVAEPTSDTEEEEHIERSLSTPEKSSPKRKSSAIETPKSSRKRHRPNAEPVADVKETDSDSDSDIIIIPMRKKSRPAPAKRNLVSSFIEGVTSFIAKTGNQLSTPSRSSSDPGSGEKRRRMFMESVEIPTRKRSVTSSSLPEAQSPSVAASARGVKRTRSGSQSHGTSTEAGDLPSLKKRKRSRHRSTSKSPNNEPPVQDFLSPGFQRDEEITEALSDDSVFLQPENQQSDPASEDEAGGPLLPNLNMTIVSPFVQRVRDEIDDDPKSDDTDTSISSPSRDHLRRRQDLQRSKSEPTVQMQAAAPTRAGSDSVLMGVKQAYNARASVSKLEQQDLAVVRNMLEGLTREVEGAMRKFNAEKSS